MRYLSYFLPLLILLLSACRSDSETRILRLGHGLDTAHPVHLGMEFMARSLDTLSGGALQIMIYPNQQLGTERQNLELLQIGSLAMTKVSAAVLENFAPPTRVLSLPYLFRSREHAYAVQDSEVGRELLLASEPSRLRGLAYFDAGQRSFYTKERPVRTPEDLAGLKIRVQESATAINMVRQLGGAPTPISWGELYTALQQGVVDGAENNPPSFYNSGHYEVAKFYSLNEHTAVPDILIMSSPVYNGLSARERGWLDEAVRRAVAFQRRLWQQSEAEALAAVEAAGVEVIRPNKVAFMDRTAAILEGYRDDPEAYALIQRIQAIPDAR